MCSTKFVLTAQNKRFCFVNKSRFRADITVAINRLKNRLRDFIPKKYQVPIKYHYNRLASMLEPEMTVLKYLVRKNDRVIDVGGNRGTYAYKCWKLGAKVEIFEPNSTCSSLLSAWAAHKNDIKVHPIGLSNFTGQAQLYVPVDNSGVEHDASGSIEHKKSVRAREQEVKLRTLDSFGFEQVNLIKIDVEGHEYNVIEGASETIRKMKPSLIIEIEQRHIDRSISDVFDAILAFEYKGFFLDEGRLIELSEFDLVRDQNPSNLGKAAQRYINNFIFLHQHRLDNLEYAELRKCEK